MIVKLSLLDRKDVLHYPHVVEVSIGEEKNYESIGTCKIFRNDKGLHFGELELDRDVSKELYFYYRSMANNAGFLFLLALTLWRMNWHTVLLPN